jgi:Mrp family chromosome partitioning ATPase
VSDSRKRRPPDNGPPPGKTLPLGTTVEISDRGVKVTPARGQELIDSRPTAPMKTVNLAALVEAGAAGPSEDVALPGTRGFVDAADPRLRTAVHGMRTERNVPVQARDPLLPTVTIEPVAEQLATHPPAQVPVEKTKIWVATHKAPSDPDPRLILLREPDSERSASFRVLRHRLQQNGDPRTIVVSSPSSDEGKTTCAANLAMALGECGRARVLLVEANLRANALAALFGFLPPDCFAAQMTRHRERPLEPWSVVEAFSPSLHVAAVKPGQESRPLLDGPAFAVSMEMLKNAGYDYLVLDTPPVLGSADVNLIQDSADGVLLVGWARKTTGASLRRAVDQLSPAKILGVSLFDV